jgi:hypothetical protein
MGMLLLQNRHACCMVCCCFKTGMRAAWHAAASKPGCMLHDMLLLQNRHACGMAGGYRRWAKPW